MEEINDFNEWLKTIKVFDIKYFAIYDTDTNAIIGVYPEHSAQNIQNKIPVDREFAESIFNGIVPLNTCFVDEVDGKLEIIQTQTVKKIDDILHRIVEKKYADFDNSDLTICYNSNIKKVIFKLSDTIKSKKIKWDGNTEVKFIFSNYNDPYKFFQVIKIKLEDLYIDNLEFNLNTDNNNFSVFTSRIFKKNVLEKI